MVQVVNLILTQALRDRASDIHIEPQGDRLQVRYRIDGSLQVRGRNCRPAWRRQSPAGSRSWQG